MLSDGERAELEDTTTDVAFWVNGSVVVAVGGTLLFVDRLWHRPSGVLPTLTVALAVAIVSALLCMWLYRQAVAAAIRWGESVRAAFDVHRLDLYDRLGVRRPTTYAQECQIARAVNRLLLFAEPVPDALRAANDRITTDNATVQPALAGMSQPSVATPCDVEFGADTEAGTHATPKCSSERERWLKRLSEDEPEIRVAAPSAQ